MIVVIIFFIYPGLTITIFKVWKCTEVDDGEFYLDEDMSLRCFQGPWFALASISCIAMCVYVIGIPLATFVVLRKVRNGILAERKRREAEPAFVDVASKNALQSLGSLTAGYDEEFWFWEVVEMIKKMLLTGGLVLIAPGSSAQILLGVLIILFYILALTRYLPFAEKETDQTQFIR